MVIDSQQCVEIAMWFNKMHMDLLGRNLCCFDCQNVSREGKETIYMDNRMMGAIVGDKRWIVCLTKM